MSNTNNGNDEWKNKELGVLYKQTSKDGKKHFLTGKINGEKVVVFSNKAYKDKRVNEAQGDDEQEQARRIPDYTVYKSEELNNGGGQAAPARRQQGATGPSRPPAARPQGAPQRRQAAPAPAQASGPLGETDDVPY